MNKLKNIFLILLALAVSLSIISAVVKVSFYIAIGIMAVLLAVIIFGIIKLMR